MGEGGNGNDEEEIQLFFGRFEKKGGDGEGLVGCGGLSGVLQRPDNQQGFILTFEIVVVVVGMGIFPFQRQCDGSPQFELASSLVVLLKVAGCLTPLVLWPNLGHAGF